MGSHAVPCSLLPALSKASVPTEALLHSNKALSVDPTGEGTVLQVIALDPAVPIS